jgi:EAL domain-containing protein (putative c-di-GMP-specific phosphodiesterase class I)
MGPLQARIISSKALTIGYLRSGGSVAMSLRSVQPVSSPLAKDDRTKPALWLAHSKPGGSEGEAAAGAGPFLLVAVSEAPATLQRVELGTLPFRIGRQSGQDLVLPSYLVSKAHAELYLQEGRLRIRDLSSRNGTFVNRKPVEDAAVAEGDVLQLGDFQFRISRPGDGQTSENDSASTRSFAPGALARILQGASEMAELLHESAVTVELQPIVRFPGAVPTAYEALGRGLHPKLPRSPVELFQIAEAMGTEVALSQLFRRRAVELARDRPRVAALFLNTHPAELSRPGLVDSLEELRTLAPNLDLTLEIHESALAQPESMGALRDRLSEINVGLAYDDFGAGQARLLELAEAPPHYLKFDRKFVSNIDRAPSSRRRLLSSLVAAARELLVKTIAEGIETEAEAEVCGKLGFTHAQGYHFGRPAPIEQF